MDSSNNIINKIISYMLRQKIANVLSDKCYLKLRYKISYGKKLNLDNPTNYNEKLQWLKLYDRRKIYTDMVDKYEVKKIISEKIGNEYVIPTLGIYDKFDDINFEKLPNQFVIKCTHDSGGMIICRNKNKLDIKKARKKINKSMKKNYYFYGREWPYKNVKPRIIIEQYITPSKDEENKEKFSSTEKIQNKIGLLDYKFLCFDGEVKLLFMDIGVIGKGTGHAEEYYRNIYDKEFNLLPFIETRENYKEKIEKPKNFDKMIEIAQKISEGIPHLRVDLYNIDGKIYFGETTFFHGSGLSNYFKPEEWNDRLGNYIKLPKEK